MVAVIEYKGDDSIECQWKGQENRVASGVLGEIADDKRTARESYRNCKNFGLYNKKVYC